MRSASRPGCETLHSPLTDNHPYPARFICPEVHPSTRLRLVTTKPRTIVRKAAPKPSRDTHLTSPSKGGTIEIRHAKAHDLENTLGYLWRSDSTMALVSSSLAETSRRTRWIPLANSFTPAVARCSHAHGGGHSLRRILRLRYRRCRAYRLYCSLSWGGTSRMHLGIV